MLNTLIEAARSAYNATVKSCNSRNQFSRLFQRSFVFIYHFCVSFCQHLYLCVHSKRSRSFCEASTLWQSVRVTRSYVAHVVIAHFPMLESTLCFFFIEIYRALIPKWNKSGLFQGIHTHTKTDFIACKIALRMREIYSNGGKNKRSAIVAAEERTRAIVTLGKSEDATIGW